ncbi:MAG: hypothetical protein R3A43_03285 [Bacteroidia bacterium]
MCQHSRQQRQRKPTRNSKPNHQKSERKRPFTIDQLTADAGLYGGTALRYCEEQNIDAYIPNFGLYKPNREGFKFNKDQNQYECQKSREETKQY